MRRSPLIFCVPKPAIRRLAFPRGTSNSDALPEVRYRQRVQKRLTRLRKRLLAFLIKANPECSIAAGGLHPVAFPHAYLRKPPIYVC
jgi:hypothetical protein